MDFLKEKFRYIFVKNRHNKLWRMTATFLAAVVVFVTTYSLILPAITMELDQADEMSGVYLEDMYEIPEAHTDSADLLSDGSDVVPEGYDDSLPYTAPYAEADFVDLSADIPAEENTGIENLTVQAAEAEAVVFSTSGALFPADMKLTLKERKEDPQYDMLRSVALAAADQNSEEAGYWTDSVVRIFELGFLNAEGFYEIPAGEMKAEFRLSSPMQADHCRIILLTDGQNPLSVDPDYIDYDTLYARSIDTQEINRNENNEVTGFGFRAESIRFAALLTKIDTVEEPV